MKASLSRNFFSWPNLAFGPAGLTPPPLPGGWPTKKIDVYFAILKSIKILRYVVSAFIGEYGFMLRRSQASYDDKRRRGTF